jgi:hypothetical protein
MTRLADYVKEPITVVEYEPPTVAETLGAMAKAVVTGEAPDPEDERLWAQAESMEAPSPGSVSNAFDKGARLAQPKPVDEPVDPALKRVKDRVRRSAGGRPAGSDEFTDLFAAGLITLIAFVLGPDFQPTAEEAKDLARPLGNILARRIDLAKKLGQDANDVVAFAVALMAYIVRVGPVATDRVRQAYRDRQERTRVGGIAEPPNYGGTGGVAAWPDAVASPGPSATYDPFNAIAKVRDHGLRGIERNASAPAGANPPLANNGQ